ncbi:sigma factor-like helix-turn-helix DNA-binding protein [Kineococcus sp. SYSU DK018]|uniref:sigma factor-like helix-turn-helix DNA-binding protein n=1 Tax=Kineococcus sp. SYSU DK018 TaxID=3383139 RepID=UPI003D7E55CE
MGAEHPERRKHTRRELAERFGVSTRTIGRLMSEPREEFLARAKARRDRAVELREQGLKHREIAEAMEVSIGTVGRLLHDAKKLAEQQAAVDQPQAS